MLGWTWRSQTHITCCLAAAASTMSDFASLLSQLDQSAKRPTAQKDNRQESRKRPRKTSEPCKPHDISQLRIRLTFCCIGAQKAGTSWLHEMLRNRVPQLALPEQKELHFWDWHRHKGLGWYSRQFPSASHNVLYGEITPCYMTLPESDIQEIHTLFPHLKIIFIARNLVDRAWSAMTMELRNNVLGIQAGQWTAASANVDACMDPVTQNRMEKESDPDQQTDAYFMNRLEHSTHTQRSDYASGLKRWLKYFPKEQILIVNYKDISQDPRGFIENVLVHVGVKKELANEISMDELEKKFNVASKPRPIRPSLRRQMEKYLQPHAKAFNELLQELGYDWTLDEYN